jgi:hypothetical protein
MVVALNDGTYIYNSTSAKEYLNSLGFDSTDIDRLGDMLFEDVREDAYREGYDDCWREDERKIDGYFCACRDLAMGIEDICNDFRKQYKSAAIMKVLDAIQKFVDENRID